MLNRQKQKQLLQPSKLVSTFGWDSQASISGLKINPYEIIGSSGHKVMTGTLYGDAETEVVVKPHTKEDRALREFRISRAIAGMGLNTPEAIGVYKGQQASYLVFQKYPGLQTLTDMNLQASIAHPSVGKVIQPRLSRAGEGMAEFHDKKVVHLDAQARNNGEGPQLEPVYFDFERTQFNSTGVNETSRAEDLYKLAGSVLMLGYLGDKKPSYRASAVTEAIVGPYQERLAHVQTDYDMYEAAVRVMSETGRMHSSIRAAVKVA